MIKVKSLKGWIGVDNLLGLRCVAWLHIELGLGTVVVLGIVDALPQSIKHVVDTLLEHFAALVRLGFDQIGDNSSLFNLLILELVQGAHLDSTLLHFDDPQVLHVLAVGAVLSEDWPEDVVDGKEFLLEKHRV